MKILLVQETDWLLRGPHQQHHLMEKLNLRGHEIRVIDYQLLWRQKEPKIFSRRQVFEDVNKIYPGAKVTVIRPGLFKVSTLDYVSLVITHRKELTYQLREFQPDIIVGFGILNVYLAMSLARKVDIPFVYYLIDSLHTLIPQALFRPVGKSIESATLSKADRIVVINRKLQEYAYAMGADKHNTDVIGAGVDLSRFRLNIGGDEIRSKYGIEPNDIVLFFMGWLYKFSGLKEVVSELARVDNKNIKCLIVGEGDIYQELKDLIHGVDLKNRVILTGKRPYEEIPELTAAADICILPADPNETVMQEFSAFSVMIVYLLLGYIVVNYLLYAGLIGTSILSYNIRNKYMVTIMIIVLLVINATISFVTVTTNSYEGQRDNHQFAYLDSVSHWYERTVVGSDLLNGAGVRQNTYHLVAFSDVLTSGYLTYYLTAAGISHADSDAPVAFNSNQVLGLLIPYYEKSQTAQEIGKTLYIINFKEKHFSASGWGV